MRRLGHSPRRFLPALALAFLALMAGVALGSSSVRDWLISGQASGAPTSAEAVAQKKAKKGKKNQVKRGPRGKRGPKGKRGPQGATGPQGQTGPQGSAGPQGSRGESGDEVYNFSVNWQGQSSDPGPGATTTSLYIPGVGTLNVSCPWEYDGGNRSPTMTFSPAADNSTTRGVASYTVAQGAGTEGKSSFTRLESTAMNPIPIGYLENSRYALPNDGMIFGNLSIEPFSGNGGSSQPPATFTMSSEYVVNDPTDTNRKCHISGQVISVAH
ncbi:MAG TPA: hypothetical protein VHV53_10980 [Solirubrobacterales bacterium]|nr:hypothetical protein [Solirubrobacterales bacterium]